MPPSATHFRALLTGAGIPFRSLELITARGAPPSIIVLFDRQHDAQRFHSAVASISPTAPKQIDGRGWVVIVNPPNRGSAPARFGQ